MDDLLTLLPYYYSQNYYAWNELSYRTILVVASVNENVTGIILSENATVSCNSEKYKLEFLSFSPSNFKPGLLYTGFVSFGTGLLQLILKAVFRKLGWVFVAGSLILRVRLYELESEIWAVGRSWWLAPGWWYHVACLKPINHLGDHLATVFYGKDACIAYGTISHVVLCSAASGCFSTSTEINKVESNIHGARWLVRSLEIQCFVLCVVSAVEGQSGLNLRLLCFDLLANLSPTSGVSELCYFDRAIATDCMCMYASEQLWGAFSVTHDGSLARLSRNNRRNV